MEKKLVISVNNGNTDFVRALPAMTYRGIKILFHGVPVVSSSGLVNFDFVFACRSGSAMLPFGYPMGNIPRDQEIPIKEKQIYSEYEFASKLEEVTKSLGMSNAYIVNTTGFHGLRAPQNTYPYNSTPRYNYPPTFEQRQLEAPMVFQYSNVVYYAYGKFIEGMSFTAPFSSVYSEKERSDLLKVITEIARLENFEVGVFNIGRAADGRIGFLPSNPTHIPGTDVYAELIKVIVQNFIDQKLAEENKAKKPVKKTAEVKPKAAVVRKKRIIVKRTD